MQRIRFFFHEASSPGGRRHLRQVLLLPLLVLAACASFNPQPLDSVSFQQRLLTEENAQLEVSVAVLTPAEAAAVFGVDLAAREIQPVWIRVRNKGTRWYTLLPISLDPEYYSALEAAYKSRFFWGGGENEKMSRYFYENQMPLNIGPGQTNAGFVFTALDEGTKFVNVELVGAGQVHRFSFIAPVPSLKADYHAVDFENLYDAGQIVHVDDAGLREALEALPCCTTNKAGTAEGDPVNIVLIGEGETIFAAFVRRGWDETEILHSGSAWKTTKSFVFGSRYRYSPFSALYYLGRRQDIGLQKARATVNERNHLRLWLSPLRYRGQPVWLGQISRDIGVRFTTRAPTLTTHKIDPDVDEARFYLLQDIYYSQGLKKYGFVGGVGRAGRDRPRRNLTGDPYFTDGLRVVMWITGDPTAFDEIQTWDWERPDRR